MFVIMNIQRKENSALDKKLFDVKLHLSLVNIVALRPNANANATE